jgi:uncharacterized protein (UPF0332 family)
MPAKSLKAKSLENIEAADLMVEKGFFNSSVHCSYYSCLQLIKLVLFVKANIDFSTQLENSKNYKDGSHVYYLNSFTAFFKNNSLRRTVESQTNNVKKLKVLRVIADYDSNKVDAEKCSDAVVKAKSFRDFIFEEIKLKV